MTAIAFIVGVIPLVVATGAGAGACQSIGTTVFGGMVLATVLGIVFVPVLFIAFEFLVQWSANGFRRRGVQSKPAEHRIVRTERKKEACCYRSRIFAPKRMR